MKSKTAVRLLSIGILILFISTALMQANKADDPKLSRVENARLRAKVKLAPELEKKKLLLGSQVFMRIFKESKELEVFLENPSSNKFDLLKTYKICTFSGKLGPKQKQGDRQAPEGFYFVPRGRMNPQSRYHLAFNLGYPNAYDRAHGRTGDYLMVHGNCVSIGCYAMTDPLIEEIYTLADAALTKGQHYFRVHCFPFRMTNERMAKAEKSDSEWLPFWKNLKEGYELFEKELIPPDAKFSKQRYIFTSGKR
jgi:murein L,D-transpeptidase YafK